MDHCIRGEESARDSRFVKELCEKMGVDCVYEKIPIKVPEGDDRSVEEVARAKRYDLFFRAAGKTSSNVIATGHTLDDQAETVLMRFLTGASLKSMAGIPPVRDENGIKIIRPLINADKKEVIGYLETVGLDYCHDSTNDEKDYLRNKVRLDILPFLEKYNPRVKRTMVNFCEAVREDMALVEIVKKKSLKNMPSDKDNSILLKDILLQPVAVRKEMFKELFMRAGGDIKKLTYRHWKDMEHFIRTAQKGNSLNLPGNVSVSRGRDSIKFQKQ